MIPGDNPAGHGFVLRDLVLIETSGHGLQLGGGGLKISEKSLLGGRVRSFNFGGGGGNFVGGRVGGGGSRNSEAKIKTS